MALSAKETRDIIYAARFQTERKRGDAAQTCIPYDRVWDARTTYGAKGVMMTQLSASDIAVNDIVLVEFAITRFKPNEGGSRYSNAWDRWTVSMELQDVILFYEAPEGVDVQQRAIINQASQGHDSEECF
ncbi:hypothetical protein PHLCEN_2v4028 [Hermanssonia centrifuga]|uniref:Uncharacterized protein n=1 Tax=Hermanssonia centrifuga TaxID=98765 RepID=A0A2R6Q5H4_9APHY|nr:hypothetical protein PHLCEN_2v4028 [Hermanssonia centrifuga]